MTPREQALEKALRDLAAWVRGYDKALLDQAGGLGYVQAAESALATSPTPSDEDGAEYVPGLLHCDKCQFRLVKTILNMASGRAHAGETDKREVCPNDGADMRRVGWKEYAKELEKGQDHLLERLCKMDDELRSIRKAPTPPTEAKRRPKWDDFVKLDAGRSPIGYITKRTGGSIRHKGLRMMDVSEALLELEDDCHRAFESLESHITTLTRQLDEAGKELATLRAKKAGEPQGLGHPCACRFNGRGKEVILCAHHHGKEIALLELTKYADSGTDPDKHRLFPWVRGYLKRFYEKHRCIEDAESALRAIPDKEGKL